MLINCYYRYGPPGSAICVYSADNTGMNGIFTVFNEHYHNIRPGQTYSTPTNIPNDNPFSVSSACCAIGSLCYVFFKTILHMYVSLIFVLS